MVHHRGAPPATRAWSRTAAAFYSRHSPTDHFSTASTRSTQLAAAVAGLLGEHPDVRTVHEVGAGTGALLAALHRLRPDLALTGIDLRPRPPLPAAVAWIRDLWDVDAGWVSGRSYAVDGPTLLLAVEFLDDLPTAPERDTRAACWAAWLADHEGPALVVDYGARGTTTPAPQAYARGRAVPPVLHPDVNLTAPVALDAVRLAGESVGATTTALLRQSDALERWAPPPDPAEPLAALAARSERHALTSPRWFGAHWWLVQRSGERGG